MEAEKLQDEYFMRQAIAEAQAAAEADEVPVGAVIVQNGQIIARAHNTRETSRCATHHAEILAIEAACRALGGWRLPDATLYVTMEPCAMCAGAAVNAGVARVVYGVQDVRFGALGSLLDLFSYPLNHRPKADGGILEEETHALLTAYFRRKRDAQKKEKHRSDPAG